MTPRQQLVTVNGPRRSAADPIRAADKFLQRSTSASTRCSSWMTPRISAASSPSPTSSASLSEAKSRRKPARDSEFRLVCRRRHLPQSASPDGELDRDKIFDHVGELVARGTSTCVAVSTAHGHTAGRRRHGETHPAASSRPCTIIAGNVTSGAGVEFLADRGANAIKIGQGPGSICTTRMVAGVGIPQLTALHVCSKAGRGEKGRAPHRRRRHREVRRHRQGAHAGRRRHPAAVCWPAAAKPRVRSWRSTGKLYKQYRGMGSHAAMKAGSAARYGHDKNDTARKVAAEGIEALKEVSGSVDDVLGNLIGGIQSGMGYLGAKHLGELRQKARYVRVTTAGAKEAAPHDVIEVATRHGG
jgi:IMP dehydrogenase